MRCAWKELMSILPPWIRSGMLEQDRTSCREIRLRIGQTPQLVLNGRERWLGREVTREDLRFCVNTASQYSPWAASTVARGYITAPGGHRIGLGGEAVIQGGAVTGLREVRSLCIRVARDIPEVCGRAGRLGGSVLIIGRPGSGKTTFLRDLIRCRSEWENGNVAVVDERGELFPPAFPPGKRTDVLSLCGKAEGMEMAIRTLSPVCIAVDEITSDADCRALLSAAWCGVELLATAHAGSVKDLYRRPLYAPLVKDKLFDHIILLHTDQSWTLERMEL